MTISSFVRTMLVVSAITIWCGVFVFVGSAVAQSITCTGTQGPLTDALGNECGSIVATGPQGPSTATATASGPTTPLSSSATSAASNNSTAISNANVGSGAEAEASNSSTANASAQDDSGATAIASNSGTANASAQDDSGDAAFASNSGTANSSAQNDSGAEATAAGSGTATATASGDSSASASTTGNGNAFADAVNDSTASATVTTANGFACAYANNGSFADAFDTSAPICTGPDAVVVSSAGSCGPVQDSPCALELQNYFSNANTTGGQASVNITAPLEGIPTASTAAARVGETCAMIYIFNTEQSMQACCGCPVTADGLLTLSISSSLAGNPVALGQIVHDGSIRIIPSLPNATPRPAGASLPAYEGCDSATGVCCDPTAASTGNQLIPGSKLVAWGQHIQNTQITENKFEANAPTPEELNDGLPGACAAITRLGSGQGDCICPSGS